MHSTRLLSAIGLVLLAAACAVDPSGDDGTHYDSGSSDAGVVDSTQWVLDMYLAGTQKASWGAPIHADPRPGQYWEMTADFGGAHYVNRWQVARVSDTHAIVEFRSTITSEYGKQDYVVACEVDLSAPADAPNVTQAWVGKPGAVARAVQVETPEPAAAAEYEVTTVPFAGIQAAGRAWSGKLVTTRGDGWEVKVWQAEGGYFDGMIKSSSSGYEPELTAFGDDARPLLKYAPVPTVSGGAAAPPSLVIRNLRVESFEDGDDGQGTRLLLRFELLDATGEPAGAIDASRITITESGQVVPGAKLTTSDRPCQVSLLVGPGGPAGIAESTAALVSRLRQWGAVVSLYQCHDKLAPVAEAAELHGEWQGADVAACVEQALKQAPSAIIILLAGGLESPATALAGSISEHGRIVHALGYDQAGAEALRNLAVNGSCASAAAAAHQHDEVARRIAATHSYSYATPSAKGSTLLQLTASIGMSTTTSATLIVDFDNRSAIRQPAYQEPVAPNPGHE